MLDVISAGFGVQSSAMLLMAAHGEIEPMPQCAVFADTGWEPEAVYQWISWMTGAEVSRRLGQDGNWRVFVASGTYDSGVLPFPVHVVAAGDIRDDQVTARVRGKKSEGSRWASLPYFTKQTGAESVGRVRRQCTAEYKIEPIEKFIKRGLLNLRPRQRAPREPVVRQWRGISVDEASRMKPSRAKWMEIRYPLAMEKRMSRDDCKAWMIKKRLSGTAEVGVRGVSIPF